MYKFLIRPLLFLINPETTHSIVAGAVKFLFFVPGIKRLLSYFYSVKSPLLKTNFAGIEFDNPVGLAAGFDKNADLFGAFEAFGFGHIEIGTVTPLPQPGNNKPRLFRLPADKALINRMGFNNLGMEAAAKKLSKRNGNLIVGGNIGKNTNTPNNLAVADYVNCFNHLYNVADYFVVNVSCPNITNLGKLQDRDSLGAILEAINSCRLAKTVKKPVLLKISPDLNLNQVDDTIDISLQNGIDGFVVSNTTITRTGLITNNEKVEAIGRGGLSGAPVRDRSTELIKYIVQKTNNKVPVIGVGGILSAQDAIDKIEAGATLVQVYTGFIYEGPAIVKKINKAILNKRLKSA